MIATTECPGFEVAAPVGVVDAGELVVEGRTELKPKHVEVPKSLAWGFHRPRRKAVRPLL